MNDGYTLRKEIFPNDIYKIIGLVSFSDFHGPDEKAKNIGASLSFISIPNEEIFTKLTSETSRQQQAHMIADYCKRVNVYNIDGLFLAPAVAMNFPYVNTKRIETFISTGRYSTAQVVLQESICPITGVNYAELTGGYLQPKVFEMPIGKDLRFGFV